MSHYHLNDPTNFLHYQIQVLVLRALIHASGYKMHFRASRARARDFQNHAQIQIFERSHGETMSTEKSNIAMKRQESPLIFGTRKSVVFMEST